MPLASAAAIAALVAVAGARREVQALAADLPIAASPPPVAGVSPAMVPVTRTVTETEYRDVPETVTETHIEHVPVTHTITRTEYRQQPVTVTERIVEPHYETVRVPDPLPDDIDLRGRRWMVQCFHMETRLAGYENRTVTHTEMRTVPVQVQRTVTENDDRPVSTTTTPMVRRAFLVTRQETVLEPRPLAAPASTSPQRHRRSPFELAEERDPLRNSNVVPLFPLGSKPSEQELNRLILQAKQDYDIAKAQGNHKERVDFGESIGEYVDERTGVSVPTTRGIIHYAKDGVYIVPARP